MTLKQFRKKNGLTQSDLASRINVNRVTIARIEVGTRAASPSLVRKFMQEFNVSVSEAWTMFYGTVTTAKEESKREEG